MEKKKKRQKREREIERHDKEGTGRMETSETRSRMKSWSGGESACHRRQQSLEATGVPCGGETRFSIAGVAPVAISHTITPSE
jgi:hypothetical protein